MYLCGNGDSGGACGTTNERRRGTVRLALADVVALPRNIAAEVVCGLRESASVSCVPAFAFEAGPQHIAAEEGAGRVILVQLYHRCARRYRAVGVLDLPPPHDDASQAPAPLM